MPGPRTLIQGGTIITGRNQFKADLVLEDERITSITADASEIPADVVIDASGMLVLPGLVDFHTHLHSGSLEDHEGFADSTQAAAAGGVTTAVEMPQSQPAVLDQASFEQKASLITENSLIDIAIWGGIAGGDTQNPTDLLELGIAGAAGYKSFMAESSRSLPAVSLDELLNAMERVASTGLPYALHAEDNASLQGGLRRTRDDGRTDPMAHAESRPPLVEALAVDAALLLSESTSCPIHICHCASALALQRIVEARQRGVQVTVETCPQYLALDEVELVRQRGYARCAPPLRHADEVEKLWDYVLDGTIDVIASDHNSVSDKEKARGDTNIFDAPNGLPGVQTLLPVFWHEAVSRRGMSPSRTVELLSGRPAQLAGLYPRKGDIAPGSDADIVLFDPGQEWIVQNDDMLDRYPWTPFAGRTLTGRVMTTIRRGIAIFDLAIPSAMTAASRSPARFLRPGYGADIPLLTNQPTNVGS